MPRARAWLKHFPKHDQEATRERDRGPRGGTDQHGRQAWVRTRTGGPGDRLRRRRRARLREGIEATIGQELVDEDYDDVADVVLLWFRDEDGDLTDALVDAIGLIEDGGTVWLLTPKTGRDGYVEPSDINEAAQTAGLAQTKSINAGKDWTGSRLVTPKGAKAKR